MIVMADQRDAQDQRQRILFYGSVQELAEALDKTLSWQNKEFVSTQDREYARIALSNESFDFAILDLDSLGDYSFKLIEAAGEYSHSQTVFLFVTAQPSLEAILQLASEKLVAAYEVKPLDVERFALLLEILAKQRNATNPADYDERLYKSIVETTKKGIWIADAGGTIRFANRQMAKLLRCDRANLVTRSRSEFIICEGQRPNSSRIDINGHEFAHIQRCDGSSFWASTTRDQFDAPQGMLIVEVFADVGGQIQAENLLTRQHWILEQRTQNLRFISNNLRVTNDVISNSLRAPLWRISGICQYLLHSFENNLDPEVVYCLRSLMRHCKDTTDILEKLIDDNQIKAKNRSVYRD